MLGNLLGGLPIVGGLLGGGGGSSGGGGGGGMLGGLLGGGGGGGGLLGGLLGGGGGGGIGGMLGGLPIVGGLLGGGGGAPQGGQGGGQVPYGPGAWPGWPVPPGGKAAPPQSFTGNFSVPGQAESYYEQNKGAYRAPWTKMPGNQGGEYWQGIVGKGQTQPQANTNYAADAYRDARASQPANMAPYYDNAQRKAFEGVDRAYGATGSLGSTRSMDRKSEAATDLRAQQAKDEAQYGLSRNSMLGGLAGAADASGRANTGMDLSWLTGLGGLGLGVQDAELRRMLGMEGADLARLNSGMGAASAAQGAMRNRGQDFFGNNLALGGQQASIMGSTYLPSIMNDQNLLQAQLDLMLGKNREGLNQVATGRAASEEGIGNLAGLMGNFMGGMF